MMEELPNLEQLIHSQSEQDLRWAAASPGLTEDLAVALLARRDLPGGVLQDLSRNSNVAKLRKVVVGLVSHPRTPRHVSIPIIRSLYTFELMHVALTPLAPQDIKMAVEDALIARLETVTSGERITLARRGSTRIAAALLSDKDPRISEAALTNPYLTEVGVVRALMRSDVSAQFVNAVGKHPKWSLRTEVRIALLKNVRTPAALALEIAQSLPASVAREALMNSSLPASVKTHLMSQIQQRKR
ncbi:MAG TPA: hypothetical protein VEG30_03570 [Terriglobales bacterium]|nr:hypothetical protein [Terriglobales bacterium]